MVCLELVLFENKLVVYFLYARKVEVRLCDQKTAIRWVDL